MTAEYKIRRATATDIPFLVETIIEAEKAGTNILSYSTIFGLTGIETEHILNQILSEEIDGCELSVSSFLVAEFNKEPVAALSAWIEGVDGMTSSSIKGNLLHYFLPRESVIKAASINSLIGEIHIEYFTNTIQIGAGYVSEKHRGKNLLGQLNRQIILDLHEQFPEVEYIYAQIFNCNLPSIKTYEKAGFELVLTKKTENLEIEKYLPSNTKILMRMNVLKFLQI